MVSNELQMLSSSSQRADFNLANHRIRFCVLFAAPKGQIKCMLSMNVSAIISLKNVQNERSRQHTIDMYARDSFLQPFRIRCRVIIIIIIMNISIFSLLIHCLYKPVFCLWSFQNTNIFRMKQWLGWYFSSTLDEGVVKGSRIKSPVLMWPMQLQVQQHPNTKIQELLLTWSKQVATSFTKLHYVTVHTMPPRVIQRY